MKSIMIWFMAMLISLSAPAVLASVNTFELKTVDYSVLFSGDSSSSESDVLLNQYGAVLRCYNDTGENAPSFELADCNDKDTAVANNLLPYEIGWRVF